MSSIDDLRQDVAEMERLLELATRQKVKSILTVEAHKLRTEITQRLEAEKKTEGGEVKPATKTTRPSRPVNSITTYAWDQSEKFFKVYVTLNGVQNIPKENITTEFTNSSFKLRVNDMDKKDHVCHVAQLHGDVVTDKSYHKVKTDMVLVMLKKKEEGKTWAYAVKKEDKKKPPVPGANKDVDPQESLMTLMKQMYDDGDDEMKRTIAKSMYEAQNKKTTAGPGGDMNMPML